MSGLSEFKGLVDCLGLQLRGKLDVNCDLTILSIFQILINLLFIQGKNSIFVGFLFLGTSGEHTESVGGVWDVSNKRRLGYSELDAIQEMAKGVQLLILLEKSL